MSFCCNCIETNAVNLASCAICGERAFSDEILVAGGRLPDLDFEGHAFNPHEGPALQTLEGKDFVCTILLIFAQYVSDQN